MNPKYDFSKMKGTEVSTQGNFIKYPECKPNQILVEGEFLGEVKNKFNPSKPNFKFRNNTGEIIILPASGQLNNYLEGIQVGTPTRITYLGKEKMKKGTFAGKEANNFKIEIFEEIVEANNSQQTLNLDNLE
jgi:hypothetical protein